MRTKLIAIVVVLQIALLAYMAGEREWILRFGRPIALRTSPIDPNDVMRGHYVRLSYDIAHVPARLCVDGVASWLRKKDDRRGHEMRDRVVYAKLQVGADKVAELVSLSDRKPQDGLFLRGRVVSVSTASVEVRFGVEAFFMQQGEADKLEKRMRGEMAGVPLEMEMAVGSNGVAVLKGYHWESLGLTVTLGPSQRNQERGRRDEWPGLLEADVVIKNHGTQPVSIVEGGACHGLRLTEGRPVWAEAEPKWVWVGEASVPSGKEPLQVITLAPGAEHKVHLDLKKPEWFVRKTGEPPTSPGVPLSSLRDNWGVTFRIEYVSPRPEDCAGLKSGQTLWQGRLRSRAFAPAGGVD